MDYYTWSRNKRLFSICNVLRYTGCLFSYPFAHTLLSEWGCIKCTTRILVHLEWDPRFQLGDEVRVSQSDWNFRWTKRRLWEWWRSWNELATEDWRRHPDATGIHFVSLVVQPCTSLVCLAFPCLTTANSQSIASSSFFGWLFRANASTGYDVSQRTTERVTEHVIFYWGRSQGKARRNPSMILSMVVTRDIIQDCNLIWWHRVYYAPPMDFEILYNYRKRLTTRFYWTI